MNNKQGEQKPNKNKGQFAHKKSPSCTKRPKVNKTKWTNKSVACCNVFSWFFMFFRVVCYFDLGSICATRFAPPDTHFFLETIFLLPVLNLEKLGFSKLRFSKRIHKCVNLYVPDKIKAFMKFISDKNGLFRMKKIVRIVESLEMCLFCQISQLIP